MNNHYDIVIFSSNQTMQATEICMAIDQSQKLRMIFGDEFLSFGKNGKRAFVREFFLF